MCVSTFLAFVVGSYLLLVNLAVLLNRPYYKKNMHDFERNPGLIYVSGIMLLVFGLLIVTCHNIWIPEWPVLITIAGWVAVLLGAGRLLFPEQTTRHCQQYHTKSGYYLIVAIWMLIGVYLIWEGFQHLPAPAPMN